MNTINEWDCRHTPITELWTEIKLLGGILKIVSLRVKCASNGVHTLLEKKKITWEDFTQRVVGK